MDTRNGCSERLLARLALRNRQGPLRLLLGGLGVGFSLAEALRFPQIERVIVVEIEPKIVEWCRTHLAPFSGDALSDPRVQLVNEDLVAWLNHNEDRFDGICLDIDNGPNWTVADANGALYADDGLAMLRERLKPGGVLTIWSAAEAEAFAERLRRVFEQVEVVSVAAPRGDPDLIYLASSAGH
jgi:spermidine synthase